MTRTLVKAENDMRENRRVFTRQDRLPPPQPLVLRIWRHHRLSPYRRLVFLVLTVNAVLLHDLTNRWEQPGMIPLEILADLIVINIAGAILVRQQRVINLLFHLALSAPLSWPLWVRRRLGKVAHFGGLHSGASIAGTLWFALFAYALTQRYVRGLPGVSAATLGLTYALLALLVLVTVMALPPIRKRYHDAFEHSHRLGGWAALLLFWAQMVSFVNEQRNSAGLVEALASSLGFWLLLLATLSVLSPWLRLRRVSLLLERPSPHVAIARLNYGISPAPGTTVALSHAPFSSWHPFATIVTPGGDGYRLIISRAGDWTGTFIDELPSRMWTKGVPTMGVAAVSGLFRRTVWVVTGSGIGPALPHLLSAKQPVHLIWSVRSPRNTYGDALVNEVLASVPRALLWDTDERGRPDLVKLALEAVRNFNVEAAVCISNQALTRKVVYGLESRGVPAYGAIWDS